MRKTLALTVVASLAVAGLAHAAGPDPIAVRQAGQDLLWGDFTGMRTVVAAKGNITKLEKPAKAMSRWMKLFPTLFPAGSEHGENTKAEPSIWSNNAGFLKAADKFAADADVLATDAKSGDRARFTAQLKVIDDDCTACHKQFKAR